jgi:endoglucanase
MNTNLLNELCMLNGTSGDEKSVREYIISKLPDDCAYSVDALGNLIVDKKGEITPENKVALFAHMDEVGFMVIDITSDGYVKFDEVGGIDRRVVPAKTVTIG